MSLPSASSPIPVVETRPWGRFELLALNKPVAVKIITVDPGQRLSLQRHTSRDEWWTALDAGLSAEVGGQEYVPAVGDRVWIPRGTTHRVANNGSRPARFLEVAFGHFDEHDIERLEDDYLRAPDKPGPDAGARSHCLTVVVPSFNERDNVAALVVRLNDALCGVDAEIVYVDDSTDDTPDVVQAVSETSRLPVRLLHREVPSGGLSGAVAEGIRSASGQYVVVMDADLQHPADLVPILLDKAISDSLDVVVASRYLGDGDASGLSSSWRRCVSRTSTLLARGCFPRRIGRACTDPMTGFFCVRRDALDLDRLRPRGFKILVEILARHDLGVAEIPFVFGQRQGGDSKASWQNGLQFLRQLADLRLGRKSRFAAVGAVGTLVNLAVMWTLVHLCALGYVVAAIGATEVAIAHNFFMQEHFVFHDMRRKGLRSWLSRLVQSFALNNIETAVRIPVLVLLVSGLGLYSVAMQAVTLAVAFVARFAFVSRVVYRSPQRFEPAERAAAVVPGLEEGALS
jgi:dolichol-phosphate mannosyltransferase